MIRLKQVQVTGVAALLVLFFGGCSKILSQRTDEQAWMEFDQEVRVSRKPASVQDDPNRAHLREELALVPVRTILLHCGMLVSPEVCYRSELTLQFDEVFHKTQVKFPDLKVSEYRNEQKEFFAFRSYENTVSEVSRFHQNILSGIDLKARERAENLFQACDSEKDSNQTIENFEVFASLNSEMPKQVYACLSRKWGADQDQLLSETTDRLGLMIVSSEAKHWIKEHQVSPVYESQMNALIEKKQKSESEEFFAEKERILKGFDRSLNEEALLKEWTEKLRTQFPYSPVEQWVMKEKKK